MQEIIIICERGITRLNGKPRLSKLEAELLQDFIRVQEIAKAATTKKQQKTVLEMLADIARRFLSSSAS